MAERLLRRRTEEEEEEEEETQSLLQSETTEPAPQAPINAGETPAPQGNTSAANTALEDHREETSSEDAASEPQAPEPEQPFLTGRRALSVLAITAICTYLQRIDANRHAFKARSANAEKGALDRMNFIDRYIMKSALLARRLMRRLAPAKS